MYKLLRRLWLDDAGAVVAGEYLMLGTIVVVGGGAGLVSMRDSVAEEMKEYGHALRAVRESHTPRRTDKGPAVGEVVDPLASDNQATLP